MVVIDVAPAWSGHAVRFQLVTTQDRQYVAFYDEDRYLTIAQRNLWDKLWRGWEFQIIPEVRLGWDSHCNIEMARDYLGHIHLCANMHGSGLVYYRTTTPDDITTLERFPMVGTEEERCTYPRFYDASYGLLVFIYRHGTCGNGNTLVNTWNGERWERRCMLFDGERQNSCYYVGPENSGIAYCWRRSSDPQTNHSLCYVEASSDFSCFSRGNGPVQPPFTVSNSLIIDAVPEHGGMLNGNMHVGRDLFGRPVVSYHKFDEDGNTQIYNAVRVDMGNNVWKTYKMTEWETRWDFSGSGTLRVEVSVPQVVGNIQGPWEIDCETMSIVGLAPSQPHTPYWRLSHRRLPANNDLPRTQVPEASMLKVVYE